MADQVPQVLEGGELTEVARISAAVWLSTFHALCARRRMVEGSDTEVSVSPKASESSAPFEKQRLEQRYQRHVNRRTGRRAGEYFEDVLVARI